VTGRAELFLGVIAVATLVTAIFQIGVLFAVGVLVMRIIRVVERLDQEIKPLLRHLDSIGKDAARAASVATAQVERIDGLLADFTARAERAMDAVQRVAGAPAREGAALMAGVRAMLGSLKNGGRRGRSRADDEDAMFI
jgi:hypothetical protein